jgi:hypothetical protein
MPQTDQPGIDDLLAVWGERVGRMLHALVRLICEQLHRVAERQWCTGWIWLCRLLEGEVRV